MSAALMASRGHVISDEWYGTPLQTSVVPFTSATHAASASVAT